MVSIRSIVVPAEQVVLPSLCWQASYVGLIDKSLFTLYLLLFLPT